MQTEKKKIGAYEILCSVHVGVKEIILGANEQNTDGQKYLCGYMERNEIFQRCIECMYSDDYIEIVHLL